MMLTRYIFLSIVVAVIVQRLLEVKQSERNAAEILKQGGKKHGDNFLGAVKILQVSWWISMIAEVWLLDRPFIPILAVVSFAAILAGQVLRYLSMQALEWRWTLPIMTVPGQPAVDYGPYAYIKHPNWLGVILEIAALPLFHSAYLTALIFSLANAVLMSQRVQLEEKALSEDNNYDTVMVNKPRFILGFPIKSKITVEKS